MTNHFDDNMQSPICLGPWKLHTTYWCLAGNGWEWENGIIIHSDYGSFPFPTKHSKTRHIIPKLFRYERFINALNNYGPRAEHDVLFGLFYLSGSQGPWWQRATKKYFPQIREYTRYMTRYSQEKNIKNYQRVPDGIMFTCCWKNPCQNECEKNCGSLSKYMLWMKKKWTHETSKKNTQHLCKIVNVA